MFNDAQRTARSYLKSRIRAWRPRHGGHFSNCLARARLIRQLRWGLIAVVLLAGIGGLVAFHLPAHAGAATDATGTPTSTTSAQTATTKKTTTPCHMHLFSTQPPNCAATGTSPKAAATATTSVNPVPATGFQVVTAISGLVNPTTVRFAPDGRVFVAEKSGVILVYASITATTPTVFADLRSEVDDYWDRGLIGLALDPNFPTNPYVYVSYAFDAPIGGTAPTWNDACPTPPGPTTDGCVISGRIARLTADTTGNTMVPGSEQVLINAWCQQFPSHTLDDLRFGPDGALYASAGEGANFNAPDYGQFGNTYPGDSLNPCGDPPAGVGGQETPPTAEGGSLRAQSLQRAPGEPVVLNGTVIRIDPATGAALPTNPLSSNSDPNAQRIVAYGLRNPYRFTFQPGTNAIWLGDVGDSTWEEINQISSPTSTPVNNFGWPCYEGPNPHPGFQADNLNICNNLYNTPGAVTSPFYAYNHHAQVVSGESCPTGTSAIAGMDFYQGNSYPAAYHGALFFADYARGCIWAMAAGSDGTPKPSAITTVVSNAGSPVDLETGPNGDLFYVDFNDGQIRHIEATPLHAIAVATNPTLGPTPLTVTFDGTQSTDSDPSATISYAWDLNGDGNFTDSTSPTPSFIYTTAGRYTVRLKTTDSNGFTDVSNPIQIAAGIPPSPTITSPSSSLTWKVADTISFSGSAVDGEGNAMPAADLSWTVILHHCPGGLGDCHIHIVQTYTGVSSGSFAAPDHEYPSYLEIKLTATDSSGMQTSTSVTLNPQTVYLTVQSNPAGLTVGMNETSGVTPLTQQVIVGSTNSISAPSPQTLGATTYTFGTWSDGGSEVHTIVAGGTSATYTANYTVSKIVPTETGKVTLSDTSIDGPSLWTAGQQPASGPLAALGWTGTDSSHHLNVMLSSDGMSYGNKITLNETSFARPSVLVVNSNVVVVAWSGTDGRHSLNVLYDAYGQRKKLTMQDTSGYAPTLAYFNGQIWIAWTGTDDNHSLNVMALGPTGLTPGAKVIFWQYGAGSPPSLATDTAGNQLLLTWTQNGAGTPALVTSPDGTNWSGLLSGLPSQQSSGAPAMLSATPAPPAGYTYYGTWTANATPATIYLTYTDAIASWSAPVALPELAIGGPQLGYPGPSSSLLLAWTGVDGEHHLNVATIQG